MTDPDRELRTHLRAASLPAAPATLRVALHQIAGGEHSVPRRRRQGRTLLVLAAAALLVVGGSVLGVGAALDGRGPFDRSDEDPSAIHASPDAETSLPSSSAPSPDGPCPTETMRILTGSEMPSQLSTPGTITPGASLRGAYVTGAADAETPQWEVWAVSGGRFSRIAVITGSVNTIELSDVSRDGTWVLAEIGRISPAGTHSECVDLYAFATDGTGVRRITRNSHDQVARAGRFSSDARYVAFRESRTTTSSAPAGSQLLIWDAVAATVRDWECGSGAALAWAPSDSRVAAICDGSVLVVDAVTVGDSTSAVVSSNPWGLGWTAADSILVAWDRPSAAPEMTVQGLHLQGASLSRSVDAPVPVSLSGEPVSGTLSVAPSGGGLLVQTDTAPSGATDVWGWGLDLVMPGDAAVQVADTGVVEAQWTDAGDGFLVLSIVAGVRHIDLHGLAGADMASVATVPVDLQSIVLRAAAVK